MKNLSFTVLFALCIQLADAQTANNNQIGSQGPLPQLNGSWKLTEYKTAGRTYYTDSLMHYIGNACKEAFSRSNKPLSGEDSAKLYNRYTQLFSNILKSTYSFQARTFFIDNNGEKQSGSLTLNTDKTVITLYIDDNADKSKTMKIDQLDDKKLVLIPVDYSGGGAGKELGRMVFYRSK